jgi:transcriptional regulator with XRE-family HTH domain
MLYWSLQDLTGTIGGVDMDSQATTLVNLIGPRRKAMRLSMQRAADTAGVHRLTWSAWEKGRAVPEEYNHAGIEAALQLPAGAVAAVIAGAPIDVPQHQPPAGKVREGRPGIENASPEQLVQMRQVVEDVMGPAAADEFLRKAIARRSSGQGRSAG